MTKTTDAAVLCLVSLALLGCSEGLRALSSAPGDDAAAGAAATLVWLPDGKQVVVNHRWLFTLRTKTFTALVAPADRETHDWTLVPSSHGKRWLWLDRDRHYAVAMSGQPPGPAQPIPQWVARTSGQRDTVTDVVFWLNDQEIFVQQIDADSPTSPRCAVLDVRRSHWSATGVHCLNSAFAQLFRVDTLAGGYFAAHSAGEGQNAVEMMQLLLRDRRKAQHTLATLLLDTPPPMQVAMQGGDRAVVVFSCRLTQAAGKARCDDGAESRWTAYQWSFTSPTLQLLRGDLPVGAALAPPDGRRGAGKYAWIHDSAVCIDDGPVGAAPDCTSLPVAK